MEIGEIKYGDILSLDIMEMEALLKQNPWFSYLREIMMEKLYHIDKEAFYQQLSQTAIFLSSRKTLYDRIHAPAKEVEDEVVIETENSAYGHRADIEQVTSERQADTIDVVQKPKVVVVGGDFFSKDDLKSISPEEDMEIKLRNSPFYRPASENVEDTKDALPAASSSKKSSLMTEDGKVNFDDLAFCTETLGHIYAQQGFYDKAIEVFSKLILLYPQKSAYFAALVNDLKKNID